MNHRLAAIFSIVAICSTPALAITAEEIVSKNLKARGGLQQIKSLRGQRIIGRISLGDREGPFRVEISKPGKIREEVELNFKVIVRTLSGGVGWTFNPLREMIEPAPLDADDIRNLTNSGDVEGPLVDYKMKGNVVKFQGTVNIEGRDAYKLTVMEKNGNVRNDYIDCETFLEVKWEGKLTEEGKQYSMESYFRDYRMVDGLAFAFLINSLTVETDFKQRIVVESVELNPQTNPAIFGKPIIQQ